MKTRNPVSKVRTSLAFFHKFGDLCLKTRDREHLELAPVPSASIKLVFHGGGDQGDFQGLTATDIIKMPKRETYTGTMAEDYEVTRRHFELAKQLAAITPGVNLSKCIDYSRTRFEFNRAVEQYAWAFADYASESFDWINNDGGSVTAFLTFKRIVNAPDRWVTVCKIVGEENVMTSETVLRETFQHTGR